MSITLEPHDIFSRCITVSDSICVVRTLSVQPRLYLCCVRLYICEINTDMSSNKVKHVGKSLQVKGSIAITGQLLNKSRTFRFRITVSEVQCLSRWLTITVLLFSAFLKDTHLSFIHKQGANFSQRVAISFLNQY